jgi:hypothetical protein
VVALGRPLLDCDHALVNEYDAPMIGGPSIVLLGHGYVAKLYKTRDAYSCLPCVDVPCHYRAGLT